MAASKRLHATLYSAKAVLQTMLTDKQMIQSTSLKFAGPRWMHALLVTSVLASYSVQLLSPASSSLYSLFNSITLSESHTMRFPSWSKW